MDKARELMKRFSTSYETTGGVALSSSAPEWVKEISCSLNCSQKVEWEIAQRLCGASDLWHVYIDSICQGMIDSRNDDLLAWVREDLSREEYIADALEEGLNRENDFFHMIQCGQYNYYGEITGELILAIEELADRARPFVAGWNMCGYSPEIEPYTFENLEDAREFIIDELKKELEEAISLALESALRLAIEEVTMQGRDKPFSVLVGGMAYWVELRPDWLENPTGE